MTHYIFQQQPEGYIMPHRVCTLLSIPANESTYVSLLDNPDEANETRDGRVLYAVKSGGRWLVFSCRDCTALDYCAEHQSTWSNFAALRSLLRFSAGGRGRVIGDGKNGSQGDSEPKAGTPNA